MHTRPALLTALAESNDPLRQTLSRELFYAWECSSDSMKTVLDVASLVKAWTPYEMLELLASR